jgi:divalent metal cation (Fe/Co/Zn/Cd) transporter
MDAVDPDLVDAAEAAMRDVPGVRRVESVRLRWIGHRVRAEAELTVDNTLSVIQAHAIADEAHHQLMHRVPRQLDDATVHVNPSTQAGVDYHAATGHHRSSPPTDSR